MDLQTLMQDCKKPLTPIEWAIYDYIVACSPSDLVLKEVAKACHVSTTTIFRFCQKLGLSGFSELKSLVKLQPSLSVIDKEHFKVTYHKIVDYIQTLDISLLKERLEMSQEIYILARSEFELRLAKEFQRIFLPLSKPIFILPNYLAFQESVSHLEGQLLWVILIDSKEPLPLALQSSEPLKQTSVFVISQLRPLSFLVDQRLMLPSLSEDVDDKRLDFLLTPYVLTLEILYLKLQLT